MPFPIHFEPAVGTEFPLHVGAKLAAEFPGRVRYSLSGGWMPVAYVDAINAVAIDQAWYDATTADIVSATLENAVVIRNHLGWRPFPKLGFQVEFGYGWVGLGGGLTGSEFLGIVLETEVPEELLSDRAIDASATLHMADVVVGWNQPIWKGLFLRVDLGAAFTVAAETTLTPAFDVPFWADDFVGGYTDAGEQKLDEVFLTYVHLPTIGIFAGWRF